MEILWGILLAVFCLVCLLIVAIVLLQPHQGEGIAGVFGGGGGEQFLGAKSISTAVWVTSTLAGVYLILALAINKIAPSVSTDSSVMAGESAPPPPAPPTTSGPEAPPAPPPDSPPK